MRAVLLLAVCEGLGAMDSAKSKSTRPQPQRHVGDAALEQIFAEAYRSFPEKMAKKKLQNEMKNSFFNAIVHSLNSLQRFSRFIRRLELPVRREERNANLEMLFQLQIVLSAMNNPEGEIIDCTQVAQTVVDGEGWKVIVGEVAPSNFLPNFLDMLERAFDALRLPPKAFSALIGGGCVDAAARASKTAPTITRLNPIVLPSRSDNFKQLMTEHFQQRSFDQGSTSLFVRTSPDIIVVELTWPAIAFPTELSLPQCEDVSAQNMYVLRTVVLKKKDDCTSWERDGDNWTLGGGLIVLTISDKEFRKRATDAHLLFYARRSPKRKSSSSSSSSSVSEAYDLPQSRRRVKKNAVSTALNSEEDVMFLEEKPAPSKRHWIQVRLQNFSAAKKTRKDSPDKGNA